MPVTLLILIAVFGALVAALVPLLLGLTSVAAALGALGFISQIAPVDDSTSSLVVLIGLAVGVDYSLFYIRREREERRAGRDAHAALDAAAATVGRAVVVSGITVMIALAGLLVTGLSVFNSIALGTMLVVAISIVGSLTVLPAVLTLLGDKINRGRLPGLERIGARRALKAARAGRTQGVWLVVARAVTRRPIAALVTTVCVLGAIAVPALDMHTSGGGDNSVPANEPVMVAYHAVEHAFPGSPADAEAGRLRPWARQRTCACRPHRARAAGGARHRRPQRGRHQGRPRRAPGHGVGADARPRAEGRRRDRRPPPKPGRADGIADRSGAHALVTGDAASNRDFTKSLRNRTPIVIVVVLALAMLLLVAAFRSLRLAASMVALNLLSVGASYGVIVAVFQHSWAQKALSFTSDGTITNWVPLFMFVILFGLSMDYTVLVLERVREARRAGLSPRDAAAEAVGATGSTVTGAAFVMVAIFAIFATLHLIQLKEWGVGLGTAVLLDATLIRGLALPAVVTLLGERGIKAPRRSRAGRGWNDRSQIAAPGNAR